MLGGPSAVKSIHVGRDAERPASVTTLSMVTSNFTLFSRCDARRRNAVGTLCVLLAQPRQAWLRAALLLPPIIRAPKAELGCVPLLGRQEEGAGGAQIGFDAFEVEVNT